MKEKARFYLRAFRIGAKVLFSRVSSKDRSEVAEKANEKAQFYLKVFGVAMGVLFLRANITYDNQGYMWLQWGLIRGLGLSIILAGIFHVCYFLYTELTWPEWPPKE